MFFSFSSKKEMSFKRKHMVAAVIGTIAVCGLIATVVAVPIIYTTKAPNEQGETTVAISSTASSIISSTSSTVSSTITVTTTFSTITTTIGSTVTTTGNTFPCRSIKAREVENWPGMVIFQ